MARRILAFLLSFCLLTACLPAFDVLADTVVTGTVYGIEEGSYLSLREGAGRNYPLIKKLYNNDVVTVLDTVKDSGGGMWHKVTIDDTTGYVSTTYISIIYEYETDEDFEAHLTAQGFPEDYKVLLRQLHTQYPKWVFKADHLPMTWATALAAETRVGVNTVYGKDGWKSMEYGAYNWDTGTYVNIDGGYVTALPALVAYYMDPRNFLREAQVFQFEDLTYSPNHTVEGIKAILPSGNTQNGHAADVLEKHAADLLKAATETGVSAYFLATRMAQEQGANPNKLATGTVSGYEGYYNFFNYGASPNPDGTGAVTNGAKYAKNQGWDTPYKCLVGSAKKIGDSYINKGQNTLYYQKFDVTDGGNGFYGHQYMTNVQAPCAEGERRFNSASEEERGNAITFSIPVYKEMPATVAAKPSSEGNNNNFLDSLSVSGCILTPTFNRYTLSYATQVAGEVTEVEIKAVPNNKEATVTGITQSTTGTTSGTGSNTTDPTETTVAGTDSTTAAGTTAATTSGQTKANTTAGAAAAANTTGGSTTTTTTTTQTEVAVSGTGKVQLAPGDNEIRITVTSTSGQARVYTLIITRNAPIENMPQVTGTTYTIGDTVTKVEPDTTVSQFVENLAVTEGQAKVYDKNGKEKTDGVIATGDILRLYSGSVLCASYPVVIYGDVNGDGKITSVDLRIIQKHILKTAPLEGYTLIAADASKDTQVVSLDLRVIQKYILGITKTLQ